MHSYHHFFLSRIGMEPFILFFFRLFHSLSGYKTDKSFYFKLKSNATKMFAAKIGRWIIFRQIHWNMVAMQTTWKQSQIKFSTDWFQKLFSVFVLLARAFSLSHSCNFEDYVILSFSLLFSLSFSRPCSDRREFSSLFKFAKSLVFLQKILFLWSFTPTNGYLCIICLFISLPGFY